MEERNYKIYCYTNLINNKKYIGRTKTSLKERAGHEGKKYLSLRYFGAAIRKYGWNNFSPEILEENLTYEEACEKEKQYIKIYDTRNHEKGYNLVEGGEGPTKEALEKMSRAHPLHLSDEHRRKISEGVGQGVNNVNYGRKHSPEFCKKQKELKRGRNHPNWGKHLKEEIKDKIREGNSKPVFQYSLEGVFIREWSSAKEASQILKLNFTGINNCLRCIRHSSGGFIWEYKEEAEREKYLDNKYILENYGIRHFKDKEKILKERDNK